MLPLEVVFQLDQDLGDDDIAVETGSITKLRRPLILRRSAD